MIDLDGLSYDVTDWHEDRFPDKPDEMIALKLAEEAGEVAGAQVRVYEITRGLRDGVLLEANVNLQKELGDLMIVWLTLCRRHGWDPEGIIKSRWSTISQRRWV